MPAQPILQLTRMAGACGEKMWQIYSVAIEELFENRTDSDDTVQFEVTLRRILDAVRA
jgi:hypothetical protein